MINGRSVIGVIPARAGSRRLPGKNLRPMAGRPMIGWTFAAARAATTLDRLVVTSDDDGVLAAAADAGIEAVRRPVALAGDGSPVIDAVEHALAAVGGAWDYVVLLQPTSPLRSADDIDAAVALCDRTGAPAALTVAAPPKPVAFYRTMDGDGGLVPTDAMDRTVLVNGAVYVVRSEVLAAARGFHPAGAVGSVMPAARSWDVDTAEEFAICEALLKL